MCVPYNNPDLVSTESNAATASFTLVFKLAGIEGIYLFIKNT
jgi:amino acid permease